MLNAEKYREYMNVYTGLDSVLPFLQEKMQESNLCLRPVKRILDYGSGCGDHIRDYYLPQSAGDGASVLGVDISPSMVDHARTNVKDPRATFQLGNIEDTVFPQLAFDKIYSTYVLHYIQDYKTAMKRFYEILNPGGIFGFILYSNGCQYKIYEYLANDPEWGRYFGDLKNLIPPWVVSGENVKECYSRALLEAGFEIIELFTKMETYVVPSMEILAESELAMNPFLNKLPAEKIPALKKDYLKLLRSLHSEHTTDFDAVNRKDEMLLGVVRKPLEDSRVKISQHNRITGK